MGAGASASEYRPSQDVADETLRAAIEQGEEEIGALEEAGDDAREHRAKLDAFQGDEWKVLVFGTTALHCTTYWIHAGALALAGAAHLEADLRTRRKLEVRQGSGDAKAEARVRVRPRIRQGTCRPLR